MKGETNMNNALIFAGGTGARMNTKTLPKQFLKMHGKPLLIYTLEKFQRCESIDKIILVCIKSWNDYAKKIINEFNIDKVLDVIPGGNTGQESIFNGLEYLYNIYKEKNSIVLIHDGVRPFIDNRTIEQCIKSTKKYGNAITISPAIETIFEEVNETNVVGNILDRNKCAMARAPQCFFLDDIYEKHLKAKEERIGCFIDSAMMMKYYGAKLRTIVGPVDNIKITTPTDFYLFRALLDAEENMQIIGV
jgi:2-C-methyl-D-erythritol 4-phosphate cytidylyltransferase